MDVHDIVRMANQIADYFKPYPEATAVTEVANHLKSYWDPRMRRQLADHVAKGGKGLDPIVMKAANTLSLPA